MTMSRDLLLKPEQAQAMVMAMAQLNNVCGRMAEVTIPNTDGSVVVFEQCHAGSINLRRMERFLGPLSAEPGWLIKRREWHDNQAAFCEAYGLS